MSEQKPEKDKPNIEEQPKEEEKVPETDKKKGKQ